MASQRFMALLFVAALFGSQFQVEAQLGGGNAVGGLLGGLTGGNAGGGLLGGLTGGSGVSGLLGIVTSLLNTLGLGSLGDLVNQLAGQLLGNGGQCGLLAAALGGCNGNKPCCSCCNQTAVGVNSVCATVGLLDAVVGTAACPAGSIIACTAQACKQTDQCNAVQLGNLACVNV